MKNWRRAHIITGLILGPFIIITAITGLLVLIFNRWELLNLHSWFRLGGIVIGMGLVFLVITGSSIYFKGKISSKRHKA